jgi:hypothetical protein
MGSRPRLGFTLAALLAASPGIASAQDVDVFVLAGQSNALATGSRAEELPAGLAAPQPNVAFWFEEGPFTALANPQRRISSEGRFESLQYQSDPEGTLFWGTGDGYGPELSLGQDLAAALPETAIVKLVISGSSLSRDWKPGGLLYRQLRTNVRHALDALESAGRTPRVAGVFWVHGEADAQRERGANEYALNLRTLVARLRQDFADPQLPFVFARLRPGLDEIGFKFAGRVRQAQQDLARRIGNTALVDSDDLRVRGDGFHLNSGGVVELGRRLAAAWLAPPALSATGLIAAERDQPRLARMRVFLTGINPHGASVDYATADGTARAGEDYLAVSGTLSFAPGVVSQSVVVPILGDVVREPRTERFRLQLSNPVGASLAQADAECVIRDDDARR